jgi:hypothetical protein
MMKTVGEPVPWQFRYRLRPPPMSSKPAKSPTAHAEPQPLNMAAGSASKIETSECQRMPNDKPTATAVGSCWRSAVMHVRISHLRLEALDHSSAMS